LLDAERFDKLKEVLPATSAARQHNIAAHGVTTNVDLFLSKAEFGRQANGLTAPILKEFGDL